MLFSSRNWFVCSLGFSPYTILSSANEDGFPFSFLVCAPYSFSFIGWNFPHSVGQGQGDPWVKYIWHFTIGTGLAVGSAEALPDGGGTLQLQQLCLP